LKNQYDVYVGVRQQSATPVEQGKYQLVFGPYHLANQPRINYSLTADERKMLGDKCVVFTAFGIAKLNGKTIPLTRPFAPNEFEHPVNVFNWASLDFHGTRFR